MTVVFQSGYVHPGAYYPLKNARLLDSAAWVTGGTPSATTTTSGYFTAGPDNSLTYERWKPTALAAIWTNTFAAPVTIDCVGIAAHTLKGCNLTIQKLVSGVWSALAANITVPDNSPIFAMCAPVAVSGFRINIFNGPGLPVIGVAKAGLARQMPSPIFGGHGPIEYGRQTVLRTTQSETGEYLGRTKQRAMLGSSYQWDYLPRAWVDANWQSIQDGIEAEPFFLAWRPFDSQSVGYVQTDAVPSVQNMGVVDFMSAKLDVRGLANYD